MRILNNIYLCIKYPFLLPKNRWTGLHYNNWAVFEFKNKLHNKAYKIIKTDQESKLYKTPLFSIIMKNMFYVILYKIVNWYHDAFLQIVHCIPKYTELDLMPCGWRKCFGEQMCKEIKQSLILPSGKKAKLRITDIKEKWGGLRFYCFGGTDETNKVIEKYEYISARTCIECGKPADYFTSGYECPYCEKCLSECDKNGATRFGSKELPWYGYTYSKFN